MGLKTTTSPPCRRTAKRTGSGQAADRRRIGVSPSRPPSRPPSAARLTSRVGPSRPAAGASVVCHVRRPPPCPATRTPRPTTAPPPPAPRQRASTARPRRRRGRRRARRARAQGPPCPSTARRERRRRRRRARRARAQGLRAACRGGQNVGRINVGWILCPPREAARSPEHGPTGADDDDDDGPGTHAHRARRTRARPDGSRRRRRHAARPARAQLRGGGGLPGLRAASGGPPGGVRNHFGTLPEPFRNPPDAFREPSERIFSPRPSASELIDPYFLTFLHNFTGNIVPHGRHQSRFFNISIEITCYIYI